MYLDDIIMLGTNFDNHLQNLGAMFLKGYERQDCIHLKPVKRALCQELVAHLGVVSKKGVVTEPQKNHPNVQLANPHDSTGGTEVPGISTLLLTICAGISSPLHKLSNSLIGQLNVLMLFLH